MVLTAADLVGRVGGMPAGSIPRLELEKAIKPMIRRIPRPLLAGDKVRYVGEPIAVVVAEDRYAAEDALEHIHVDYRVQPAVSSVEQALRPDCPPVHPGLDQNLFARFTVEKGNVEEAFSRADGVVRSRFRVQRHTGMPMETRGVLAVPQRGGELLQVWSSTQVPHLVRNVIADCLRRPRETVQVTAPEVGGGFGVKCNPYPEEVLVAFLALELGKPVQWTEDRREHFLSTTHAREQIHEAAAAFLRNGKILAVEDRFWLDNGAYNPSELSMSYNTSVHMLGPYDVAHFRSTGHCVATHKTPMAPYRGAGRPGGVFVMDRLIDQVAKELDMDPAEVRRINLIPPEAMPYHNGMLYKDGAPMTYDSGDYPLCLEKALQLIDYQGNRREQIRLRQQGRFIGLGLSCYVEGTGIGPYESAKVTFDSDGSLQVATGSATHGQGHETSFAQICAEVFPLNPARIRVVNGDTNALPYGIGTFHSRSGIVGGNAVFEACLRLRGKMLRLASEVLEIPEEDLELTEEGVKARGTADRALSYRELARFADPSRVPAGMEPGLNAVCYYRPETVTYANGVHAALVEVDPDTGFVKLLRYVVVHDCGVIIHPGIVEGQVSGGAVQGLGGALWEDLVYDTHGQLLTTTFMDYLLPQTSEVPEIEMDHVISRSTRNPLGIKGAGEGGAIAPAPAVANAVEDALRPWGVTITEMPLNPDRLLQLILSTDVSAAGYSQSS